MVKVVNLAFPRDETSQPCQAEPGAARDLIAEGRDADVILLDTCPGGACDDALSALTNGDIPAAGAVFSAGIPRFVGRSRNTPATNRPVRVAACRLPMDFSGAAR